MASLPLWCWILYSREICPVPSVSFLQGGVQWVSLIHTTLGDLSVSTKYRNTHGTNLRDGRTSVSALGSQNLPKWAPFGITTKTSVSEGSTQRRWVHLVWESIWSVNNSSDLHLGCWLEARVPIFSRRFAERQLESDPNLIFHNWLYSTTSFLLHSIPKPTDSMDEPAISKSFVTLGMFIIDEFAFMDEHGEPTGRILEPQES